MDWIRIRPLETVENNIDEDKSTTPKTIAVLLYEDFTMLEAVGAYQTSRIG